jgi:DNA-binding IscR family transcriptional regulator
VGIFADDRRDRGRARGVSRQRAHDIVHQMAVEKMIEVVAGKPRGIRLIDPPRS